MNVTREIPVRWARRSRRVARFIGAVAATAATLLSSPLEIPSASAALCPEVEVVFARGTTEAPGVGGFGQDFVESLKAQVNGKSVGVYAVNYPASTEFPTAADGVIDASNHVRRMATDCPGTRMVLGGYSQGAAVMGYVTADRIPKGFIPPAGITGPMPPAVANHVAAVALLGKPSNAFLDNIGAPPITIGRLYAAKTVDLCAPGDPVCNRSGDNPAAHRMYASDGMVAQAATFAASRI